MQLEESDLGLSVHMSYGMLLLGCWLSYSRSEFVEDKTLAGCMC